MLIINTRLFRQRIAAWATFGFVAASLVAITPAANANGDSGSVAASSYGYTRDAVNNTVSFRAGEGGQIVSNAFLSDEYSGWPVANNTVFTRTAFSLKNLPAALVPEYYPLEVSRNWYGSEWTYDEELPSCDGVDDNQTTLTIASATNCINNLSVRDSYYLVNDTAGTLVVDTNFSSQVMKVSKKGEKVTTISTANGLTNSLYGSLSVDNVESVSLTSSNGNLYTNFDMCIDEALVADGDLLDIDYSFTFNNTAVPTDDFVLDEGDGSEYGTWDMTESALTFDITDAPEENLNLSFSLSMYDDVNYEDTTAQGTYAGTVDVKLQDGTSVTEPCPNSEAVGWPTLATVDGEIGSAGATTSNPAVNLPADALTSNDNFNQYSHQPDGFGGMFYWGYPGATWEDNPNSVVSVVHLDGNTANNTLAGAGEIEINTGKFGNFELARFGVNGGSWFALVPGNKGAYIFQSGSMPNPDRFVTTFSSKTLNGLCGRGFSAGYVSAVSAATVNPLLHVDCANRAISKSVLAKVVSGRVSVVTTLGTGSSTRPCVVSSLGTDTRASGTQAALVYYTRVSSKDVDGYCGSAGATVSSRSITTVTAALAADQRLVTSNPWTGREEPASLNIAAGSISGTWFGMSNEMIEVGYSPHFPTQLFSMTGSAITIESDDIVLDDPASFGDWGMVTPLYQESPTKWSLMITGSTEFDGEGISRATIATINPDTGVVTNGDILEMTGMGDQSSRILARFSSDSDGNAAMYTVTSADTYKTTVWSFDN